MAIKPPQDDEEEKIYETAIENFKESPHAKSLETNIFAINSLEKQFAEHKLDTYRRYGKRKESAE